MGIRGYQKYNMIVADESQYPWGGTDYSLFALKSGTTVPTGLSTSATTSEVRTAQASITDATFEAKYAIPQVFDVLSIIEGTVEGTLKMGVKADKGDHVGGIGWVKITAADLVLYAIDSDGNSRTLSDVEIWSGLLQSTTDGGTVVTKQIMYWVDVEDITLSADERIIPTIRYTYSTYDSWVGDTFTIYVYSTQDTDETTVTLPFVM